MKVRLEPGLQLVITPESYVEQVALIEWSKTNESRGILIEAIPEIENPSTCENCGGRDNHHTVECYLGEPKEQAIYSKPDCLFAYCPHPEECKAHRLGCRFKINKLKG